MLKKYEMELDELKHPLMVEEGSYECPDERLNSPEKIVRLLNECFRLDKKAEEYVYMLAFDAKCNPLGVFELGHGSAGPFFIISKSSGEKNITLNIPKSSLAFLIGIPFMAIPFDLFFLK